MRAARATSTSRSRRPAGRLLTTQLYFPGEPKNAKDGLFRRELLMRTAKNEGWLAGRFDFVLDMR